MCRQKTRDKTGKEREKKIKSPANFAADQMTISVEEKNKHEKNDDDETQFRSAETEYK